MAEKQKYYCKVCRKTMDEKEFYLSHNVEKYPPSGRMDTCKHCLTLCVDNWDPETFKPILKEIDVPYIKQEWDNLLDKYSMEAGDKLTGTTILGRYLAKMKLRQWKNYRWADSEKIQQELDNKKAQILRDAGKTEEEITAVLAEDAAYVVPHPEERDYAEYEAAKLEKSLSISRPDWRAKAQVKKQPGSNVVAQAPAPASPVYAEEAFESTLDLTDEDKTYLRLKWGRNYTPEEWVTMEQLYTDMCESYDIQSAGHKDTLKMVCKTSLKANQLIDAGDLEGFQKMSRVYDTLMRSGKFTAAQNKTESGNFIDAVSELVAICEKQGFIPRYYTDGPQDKVDRTLQDYQGYVRTLIEEENGLGDKIESAAKQLLEAQKNEMIDEDDEAETEESFEDKLFSDEAEDIIEDEDFQEFRRKETEAEDADAEYLERILAGKEK